MSRLTTLNNPSNARTNAAPPKSENTHAANAARNSVRGPLFWQVDFALQKRFGLPIGSNTNLEVRGEACNLLNRCAMVQL